jgi:hypothetical protein
MSDAPREPIEFTQLCDEWFGMVAGKRAAGEDVLSAWKTRRGGAGR